MATFQALPVELFWAIFWGLPSKDLRSLCLVCSHFRGTGQACLYKRIDLWWDAKTTPPIISLSHTLIRRPELATLVHELVLDGSDVDFYDALKPPDSLPPKLPLDQVPPSDMQIFHDAIPALDSLNDRHLWVEGLRHGTMDAYATLLVALLPNLCSITIANSFAKEVSILGVLLRALISPANKHQSHSILRQLRRATYMPAGQTRCHQSNYDATDVLPFFNLPKIEKLDIWVAHPKVFSWPPAACVYAATLVDLKLVRIREPYLEEVLRYTTQLKSFDWEWYYGSGMERAWLSNTIDLDGFFQALAHVARTLESLTIKATINLGYDVDPGRVPGLTIRGSMKPLKDYPRLTSIDSPACLFLGLDGLTRLLSFSDALPPSIERVTFNSNLDQCEQNTWAPDDAMIVMREWLRDSPYRTPRIRNLEVDLLDGIEYKVDRERIDELSSVCTELGVTLRITSSEWLH